MPTNNKEKISVDLFCSVIDNYGDIGVCYRLARELSRNHKFVSLYVDDLQALRTIEPSFPLNATKYQLSPSIIIKYWSKVCEDYTPADVIIECFACNLDESYIKKMTSRTLWINLEYLSAESWIEGCHKLPSFQNNGVNKYFFFPGFTNKTGGLNFEENYPLITYDYARHKVQELLQLPVSSIDRFTVQIFTYETPQLFPLLSAILKHHPDTIFLLPEGRSTKYLLETRASDTKKIQAMYPNALWHVFPMQQQEAYSYIIKACDLNVVRGEDSISQAVINGRPFLWHIYQQKDNIHLDKLRAFTELFTQNTPPKLRSIIEQAFLALDNSSSNTCSASVIFNEFMIEYCQIFGLCKTWSESLIQNNSLGRNLSEFINNCLDKE